MSETQGRLFKEWLIQTGKMPNTANAYLSGVNTVSKHLGNDVLDITDLDTLETLYRAYGPSGAHAQIGASNSNNVQNGLRQWLDYQRHLQMSNEPGIDPVEGRKQWQAFLVRWPLEQVRALTLEQYYGTKGDDSFYSWLRDRTMGLGYFSEGPLSAGVRPLGANSRATTGTDTQTDGRYIWYSILGSSAQEAFEHLKRELFTAIEAVQKGDLNLMSGLKIAPGALVWKVAFLYQDQTRPLVLPFYTSKQLKRVAGPDATGTVPAIQQLLMSQRGDQDVLAFAAELERRAIKIQTTKLEKDSPSMVSPPVALNQILFGPPGTGKTYNTINQALAILAPEVLAQNSGDDAASRKRLKDEFDRFVAADRVRFVTFHQSFSYEDFVEGLRAYSDADCQVKYSVESGVFKRICDDARTRPATDLGVRTNPAIWKISIDGTGITPAKSHCLANGEARIGWGNTGDLREGYEQSPYYQRLGDGTKGTLSYFAEQMAVGDILLCIHSATQVGSIGVVTSDYRYEVHVPAGVHADYQHVRSVRWLYRGINLSILPLNDDRQFTLKTVYAMDRFTWADLLSYLQQQGVKPVESVMVTEAVNEPYVLIIDEINRGNVSRIFGELITLIEESKREGAVEALSVKLPYSKKPFSVPENVYLIGTMNTADRSLAGLDIALRRRFVFREMPPRPELLDGLLVESAVDVGQMLRVMNQRIEVLLDRDHCLGHAYFMPLKTDNSLARLELVFRNQILPLLQEYFFEDWQRIAWVLNDHRKAVSDQFIQQRSNLTEALFGLDVGQGLVRDNWILNKEAFGRLEAYLGISDSTVLNRTRTASREAAQGDLVLRELDNGSIEVWRSGVLQQTSMPVLRALAEQLGIRIENGSGNPLNTRSLGRQLIDQLNKDQV